MTAAAKQCLFCEIVTGGTEGEIVFDNETSLAFLDIRPLFPGHCLLVPKKHTETLVELEPGLVAPLFATARILSGAVQAAMQSQGSFVAINNVVSQSVPHLHIHIVPRNKGDGLKGFFWPRNPYRDDQHRQETASKIRQVLSDLKSG